MTDGKKIMVQKLRGKIPLLLPGWNRISIPNVPYTIRSNGGRNRVETLWPGSVETLAEVVLFSS